MKKLLFVLFAAALAAAQTTISTPLSNFPLINSGPPPACVINQPFNFTLTSVGGIPPVSYSTNPACPGASCWLPTGCASSLNSANGALNCTPTVAGTYSGAFSVTDAVGNSSSTQSSILCTNPLAITPQACPSATVSSVYAGCTPTATGGIPPYTWIAPTGLPTGISQTSSSTGALGGTPTGSAGLYNFVFTVKDSTGAQITSPSSIQLNSAGPTCGPNGATSYACSAFCTGVAGCPVVNVPTPPFTSANSALNTIAYDTSLNPSGTDPILRASDPTLSGFSFCVSPTAGAGSDNMFSSDDTIVMAILCGQSASVALGLNPSTQQILSTGTQSVIPNAGGTYFFAHQTAKTLYSLTTGSNKAYPMVYKTVFSTNVNPSNPANYTQTLVFNPFTSCPGLSGIALNTVTGGSITLDLNDTTIHFGLVTSGQNSVGYIGDYTLSNGHCTTLYTGSNTNNLNVNGVVSSVTLPCAPIGLHNTNLFDNGIWSRFSVGATPTCTTTTNGYGAVYYQIGTSTVFTCGAGSGHNVNGYNVEVIVSNPNWYYGDVTAAQATFCNNVNGAQTYGKFPYVSIPGDAENHFSFSYIDTADTFPITGGTAWANWPGNPFTTSCSPGSCAGISEVYAIQRSPYHWIRFTHSFTSGSVLCPDCDFRSINNITATSQTGKFIMFGSDMLLSLGTDSAGKHRQDIFIVKAQ